MKLLRVRDPKRSSKPEKRRSSSRKSAAGSERNRRSAARDCHARDCSQWYYPKSSRPTHHSQLETNNANWAEPPAISQHETDSYPVQLRDARRFAKRDLATVANGEVAIDLSQNNRPTSLESMHCASANDNSTSDDSRSTSSGSFRDVSPVDLALRDARTPHTTEYQTRTAGEFYPGHYSSPHYRFADNWEAADTSLAPSSVPTRNCWFGNANAMRANGHLNSPQHYTLPNQEPPTKRPRHDDTAFKLSEMEQCVCDVILKTLKSRLLVEIDEIAKEAAQVICSRYDCGGTCAEKNIGDRFQVKNAFSSTRAEDLFAPQLDKKQHMDNQEAWYQKGDDPKLAQTFCNPRCYVNHSQSSQPVGKDCTTSLHGSSVARQSERFCTLPNSLWSTTTASTEQTQPLALTTRSAAPSSSLPVTNRSVITSPWNSMSHSFEAPTSFAAPTSRTHQSHHQPPLTLVNGSTSKVTFDLTSQPRRIPTRTANPLNAQAVPVIFHPSRSTAARDSELKWNASHIEISRSDSSTVLAAPFVQQFQSPEFYGPVSPQSAFRQSAAENRHPAAVPRPEQQRPNRVEDSNKFKNHAEADNSSASDHDEIFNSSQQMEGLTPQHLKKAKLIFFYMRYPTVNKLMTYFGDVKFKPATKSQLVKWFSNFREFFYIQMEKFARQALADGITNANQLQVSRDSELYRVLEQHFNKSNDFKHIPQSFDDAVLRSLREFFVALRDGKDNDPSWKKVIYKDICKLDKDVPRHFWQHDVLEHLDDVVSD